MSSMYGWVYWCALIGIASNLLPALETVGNRLYLQPSYDPSYPRNGSIHESLPPSPLPSLSHWEGSRSTTLWREEERSSSDSTRGPSSRQELASL